MVVLVMLPAPPWIMICGLIGPLTFSAQGCCLNILVVCKISELLGWAPPDVDLIGLYALSEAKATLQNFDQATRHPYTEDGANE
jgi:hypothetical protein